MSGTAPRIDIQSVVAVCIEGITAATTILAVQYFHFQFQPQGIALQWEAATKLQQLQIQIQKQSLYYSKQDTKSKETSVQEGGQ